MMGTRETGARSGPTRGELQDDLMRFEGRFAARLMGAFNPIVESSDPALRLRAARDQLAFVTSALDIAVGSAPEVDLLDMLTLVALGREATARRWSPETCGEAALGVAEAFRASAEDISAVAAGVISGEVEAELRQVIREWQDENPDNDDVAGVRLSAYAKYRGSTSADKGGLFSLLRGASETADTAVLLGDRALYATQRLPNLVRLHVRIATREAVADAQRAAKHVLFKGAALFGGLAIAGGASWVLVALAQRLAGRHGR
jgi:hypothetical protein